MRRTLPVTGASGSKCKTQMSSLPIEQSSDFGTPVSMPSINNCASGHLKWDEMLFWDLISLFLNFSFWALIPLSLSYFVVSSHPSLDALEVTVSMPHPVPPFYRKGILLTINNAGTVRPLWWSIKAVLFPQWLNGKFWHLPESQTCQLGPGLDFKYVLS